MCLSHFCLLTVSKEGVCLAGGSNSIAELNLYLAQPWHLQQALKSSFLLQTFTERCKSRCDTFALHISHFNCLSKDMKQMLK